MSWSIQDVTERVAMENALQARRSGWLRSGMLAAGVAHEVNTPITGISSYAQMLLQDDTPQDDPRLDDLLKQSRERQTFRAARIVSNSSWSSRGISPAREGRRSPSEWPLIPLVDE